MLRPGKAYQPRGFAVFAVEVTEQIMIAHSFRGEVFGPAQRLHGATFVVRAAFLAEQLDGNGIVVDIGRAHDVLKAVLAPLSFQNLDDLPQFKGINTTTEFLTKYVFDQLAAAARAGNLGRDGRALKAIRITVDESPLARASYEAPLS
jgi:6-pyruvoyl-tetrahydropterin synthase